jgi:ketosteroid isomerase-like protein
MNLVSKPDPMAAFSRFLKDALQDFLRPDAHTFLEMLAPDAVMEFPYTPPSGIKRLEGRVAIEKYLDSVADMLCIDSMTLQSRYLAQEGETVILEFNCTGSGAQTGKPYNQNYISVIALKDGAISHYRDYWNPLIAIEAMGGAQAIEAGLEGAVS